MPNLIAAAFLLHRFPALFYTKIQGHEGESNLAEPAIPMAAQWSSGGGHVGLLESQAVGTAAVS